MWQALKKFYHQLGSPRWFYSIGGYWMPWLLLACVVLLGTGTIWGLAFAPADYQQGNSFRIMYVHVPAAMLCQSIYLMMGVASVVLLVWRMKLADMFIVSAAPIGAVLTALALFSGSVWGRPTWGTWWEWDARTTSMLVQMFLYLGVIALRGALPSGESAGRACALLVLVGVVNIPIIKYSVEWWNTLHQPASFTLTEKPAMPASMWLPLLINVVGFYLFFFTVVIQRLRAEILMRERRAQWVQKLAGSV